MDDGLFDETIADKAVRFQNGMIATATGGNFDGGDLVYKELRTFFASRGDTKSKLPDFVRRCSDLSQFWGWIKYEKASYAERRTLIWEAFRPLIEYLEAQDRAPGVAPITDEVDGSRSRHLSAKMGLLSDKPERRSHPHGDYHGRPGSGQTRFSSSRY